MNQETYYPYNLIAWEKMEGFELGTNFKAWIYSIARNCVKQQLKTVKRHHALRMDEELMAAIDAAWNMQNIERFGLKQRALDVCLQGLDQSELELLDARYSKDTNIEKYASQVRRSADSLRTTICRLRVKLRHCVEMRLKVKGGLA